MTGKLRFAPHAAPPASAEPIDAPVITPRACTHQAVQQPAPMTLHLLPVAACLICTCSLSLARPTWTRLDATDLGTNHADLGSARYSAGRVQADTLFEAKRATLLEGNATPYRSIVSAVVIDCPTWA